MNRAILAGREACVNKIILSALAAVALATPALAADKKVAAAAPPEPYNPWDVAFGGGVTSDYIFRGITQSNHKPSVAAYFEPRYNVTKDLQYYVGVAGESISFPNRAAAEVDIYGGVRPTFGPLALDFGAWYYWYPGGECFNGSVAPVFGFDCLANGYLPINGNVIKKDLSFYEGYAKATYTVNDQVSFGAAVFYSPSVLNSGAPGTYVSGGAKFTAPSNAMPTGWGSGVGITKSVFTLDFRYYDTNYNKGDCNAFTSDHTARFSGDVTGINPGGFGSTWCSASFVVTGKFDLTAIANLK